MRKVLSLLSVLAFLAASNAARAQDVLYRCETADGISIQGVPCPKGAIQRKIEVQRTTVPATPEAKPTAPATTPAPAAATPKPAAPKPAAPGAASVPASPPSPLTPPPAPRPGTHWVLVTDDALMHGPADPYPLWQCMRADGSTYDSRDGIAGKQWVPTGKPEEGETAADTTPVPPTQANLPKGPIVRPLEPSTSVAEDTPKTDPPPPGAPPGQWVADQCQRLEPKQACERFAARRDALRRQIYAALPSERPGYAPEEQDLTRMLYGACGM